LSAPLPEKRGNRGTVFNAGGHRREMKSKKLFGKLNIVDIIIILVIVAAAVFFAVRYLNVGDHSAADIIELRYTVEINMPEELYNEVSATLPAGMISGKETVPGTILSCSSKPCTVESIKSSYPYGTDVELTIIPGEDEKYVTAHFECVATINANSVNNEFGAQELRVGRVHYLKSRDFELVGVIIKMSVQE